MDRLTDKNTNKCCNDTWDLCGLDDVCKRDCWKPTPCKIPRMVYRLAEYEDSNLTPTEVAELAQAKADGRVVVLDEQLALSMCAGARAIETSRKFYGTIYAYDIFGNQREIPYKVAAQKLRGEAEKELKECEK